jgi:Ser/Thr protein kinase RdoA (MazF antagonist)
MESIFNKYGWSVLSEQQLHQGLINSTYSISTTQGDFILQTVNHHIFKDPWAIDSNINSIGNYINQNAPNYIFTHLVPTTNGETLIEWEGQFYRAFKKINAYSLSVLDNPTQAKEAASQFGKFTQVLSQLDIKKLKITLPDFHNLSLRYHQFSEAITTGNSSRIDTSKDAISYLESQKPLVTTFENFIQNREALQRVTHHDTKISNVLFQKENGIEKASCVIDLDTVMPGFFISDVGDMCRTYLCKVSEEESNLNLIQIEKERWEFLKNGYLSQMQNTLSNFEMDHFMYAGQFMIYMQALRFLTDHLNNDSYYGAKYEGQNFVRAVNQIELLKRFNESIIN